VTTTDLHNLSTQLIDAARRVWTADSTRDRALDEIRSATIDQQRALACWLLRPDAVVEFGRCTTSGERRLWEWIAQLLQQPNEWTASELAILAAAIGLTLQECPVRPYESWFLSTFSRAAQTGQLTDDIKVTLAQSAARVAQRREGHDWARVATELRQAAGNHSGPPLFDDPWGTVINTYVGQQSPEQRAAWSSLLFHAANASGGTPTAKWKKQAAALAKDCGPNVASLILDWLRLLLPEPGEKKRFVYSFNEDVAKGLVWLLANDPVEGAGDCLRALAEYAYEKIPGVGPRSNKIGNACLYALGVLPGGEAIAQLNELSQRLKYPQAKKFAERRLAEVAKASALALDDLRDSAVPTYGLDTHGRITVRIDDAVAELAVVAPGELTIAWTSADGRVLKSAPKAKSPAGSEALKQFKKLQTDIKKSLVTQRRRLEERYLQERVVPFDFWRAHFLAHPLLGPMCRALIWTFVTDDRRINILPTADGFADVTGTPVAASTSTQVKLWHPLHDTPEHATQWRDRIFELRVTQPFRQAFRETYERPRAGQPDPFSECFAGLWLRQHQFAALLKERGWSYSLMGSFDGWNAPTRSLPSDLRVEIMPGEHSSDTSAAGISLAVQVKSLAFEHEDRPLDHHEVDPVVYSEILRDVDMFVSRSAIGAAADWQSLQVEWATLAEEDRQRVLEASALDTEVRSLMGAFELLVRPKERSQPGWLASFIASVAAALANRPLPQSIRIRGELLRRLLPMHGLDTCSHIDGAHLFVIGASGEYRIHLGSGACFDAENRFIVPPRRARSNVETALDDDPLVVEIVRRAQVLREM
jgi:hypothetical protein